MLFRSLGGLGGGELLDLTKDERFAQRMRQCGEGDPHPDHELVALELLVGANRREWRRNGWNSLHGMKHAFVKNRVGS